jgi:hypothetical protein
MYFNKYQKYLLKNEYQQGGKYGFYYKYSNKVHERQFSIENQELIQKAINMGISFIDIEHEISEGPNKGKKVIYNIFIKNNFGISLIEIIDENKIILIPLEYSFKMTGPVALSEIPDIIIDKEYSTTNFGLFSDDEQKQINNMFINNKDSINIIKNIGVAPLVQYVRMKINKNKTINYINYIRKTYITIPLISKQIIRLPLMKELDERINPDSIILFQGVRMTPVQINQLDTFGIKNIKSKLPENERLTCNVCTTWEKNRTYVNCGHMYGCDSCSIMILFTENRRDAQGRLIARCPICRVNSDRLINTLYGGNNKN